MKNQVPALYIHIPFCDSICSYCDFPKMLSCSSFQDKYIDKLIYQLENIEQHNFETIYIGGGTPSSLSVPQLDRLLSFIAHKFDYTAEFSFEANPENLNLEKIELLRRYGISRVSLGVQTFNKDSLHLLNRKHTKEDVVTCVKNLQQCGIENINLDFIFGLRIEKFSDYLNNIRLAFKLGVKHISYYALQIEKGTKLYAVPEIRKDSDELADDYDYIVNKLAEYNYQRYEISNFCQRGFESRHNLVYWNNREYYGIGLGATGYIDHYRLVQTRNIKKYIDDVDTFASRTHEDKNEDEFTFLMLNLRLEQGFSLSEFKKVFKKDFLQVYQKELVDLQNDFIIDDKSVRIRPDKFFILDAILVDLLHFEKE